MFFRLRSLTLLRWLGMPQVWAGFQSTFVYPLELLVRSPLLPQFVAFANAADSLGTNLHGCLESAGVRFTLGRRARGSISFMQSVSACLLLRLKEFRKPPLQQGEPPCTHP